MRYFIIVAVLAATPGTPHAAFAQQPEQPQTKQRSMTRVHVQLLRENVSDRVRSLHRECQRK